ncbi:MAG TPA: class I SAM-dependent methyltransferase, partial [Chloroflexota bacterium]|nr:class I SAM-dependent methyltransferase [Chloroflexota bacterium]
MSPPPGPPEDTLQAARPTGAPRSYGRVDLIAPGPTQAPGAPWPPQAPESLDAARRRANRARVAAWFDRYAHQRAAWRTRNRYYYQEIERLAMAAIPPGARVLELGCGIGDLLAAVRPSLGVGIDLSEEMVRVARRRHPSGTAEATSGEHGKLLFLRGDAHAIPLGTTFDYVICSDLLGHADDIQVLLEGLHAVCTPQTKILITYWNFVWHGVMWLAERLGLKMPEDQLNWLGMPD